VSSHNIALYNDRIYLLLGETGQVDAFESRDPTDEIYIFDLISGEERELDPGYKPNGRRNSTVVQRGKEVILFAGDDTDLVFRNDTWIFNLETEKWRMLTKMQKNLPPERRYQAITLHGPHLYLIGGEYETIGLDDFWRLDIKNQEWKEIAMGEIRPRPGRYASLVTIGDTLWHFGGRNESERFNNLFRYDVKEDVWDEPKTRGITPLARSAHTCCVFDSSFFIFGGNSGSSSSELFEFNTITMMWTPLKVSGPGPMPRFWHSAAISEYGEMYISAGYHEVEKTLDDLWKIQLVRPNSKNDIRLHFFKEHFKFYQDVIFVC
jgi:N-acetylneuraminic acid mutarotase